MSNTSKFLCLAVASLLGNAAYGFLVLVTQPENYTTPTTDNTPQRVSRHYDY